ILHGAPDLRNRGTPLDGEVELDPYAAVLVAHADAAAPRQVLLDEPAHAGDVACRVGGVARDDVAGDRGAFHAGQRTAVLRTSSVASGRDAKRNGTNVVPSPAETWSTAAGSRYAPWT